MKILELDRKFAREDYNNNYEEMIARNDGILYDNERIKRAFAYGRGTIDDLKKHIENNRKYCKFYDIEHKRFI